MRRSISGANGSAFQKPTGDLGLAASLPSTADCVSLQSVSVLNVRTIMSSGMTSMTDSYSSWCNVLQPSEQDLNPAFRDYNTSMASALERSRDQAGSTHEVKRLSSNQAIIPKTPISAIGDADFAHKNRQRLSQEGSGELSKYEIGRHL